MRNICSFFIMSVEKFLITYLICNMKKPTNNILNAEEEIYVYVHIYRHKYVCIYVFVYMSISISVDLGI